MLRNMYISSCGEKRLEVPLFEELPNSLPHRFSAVLTMISEALICGLEGEGYREIRGYLEIIRGEILKLYTDLLLEEKEYGLKLRPHRIEDLLRILAEKRLDL